MACDLHLVPPSRQRQNLRQHQRPLPRLLRRLLGPIQRCWSRRRTGLPLKRFRPYSCKCSLRLVGEFLNSSTHQRTPLKAVRGSVRRSGVGRRAHTQDCGRTLFGLSEGSVVIEVFPVHLNRCPYARARGRAAAITGDRAARPARAGGVVLRRRPAWTFSI
jgi:hypothetical protein